MEFIIGGITGLLLGMIIGSILSPKSTEIDLSKLKIPYTDPYVIRDELREIRNIMAEKPKSKDFYDVGEQLNTIVKILSRAYPPKDGV